MAGGRFQGVANTFVEAMEAKALAKTAAAPGASTAEPSCPCPRPCPRPCAGETTTAVHTAPPPKKAKRDQPTVATGKPGSGGGIRRIKMPPLDVFQRDYMETATPVILSGVSQFSMPMTDVPLVRPYRRTECKNDGLSLHVAYNPPFNW